MVLLGEGEECNYRLIRRRALDVITPAPVAGFQSYLWGSSTITDAQGPNYISPFGGKIAPLRNMRVSRLISIYDLLEDGKVTTYKIRTNQRVEKKQARKLYDHAFGSPLTSCLDATTWITFGGLLYMTIGLQSTSWIGTVNLLTLAAWSIVLRSIDRAVMVPGQHRPSHPDRPDAIVFLGRRHSALILEGSRADIARWSGSGLQLRKRPWATWLHWFSRFGTICLLMLVFITVPNGTTQDQIIFIAFNILGQINCWVGQRLHSRHTFKRLELVREVVVPSRTHVYAILIKAFGNGKWVDAVDLLPKGESWNLWRGRIHERQDAKLLWEECEDKCSLRSSVSSESSGLSDKLDGWTEKGDVSRVSEQLKC